MNKKVLIYNLIFFVFFLFIFLEFIFPLFFNTPKLIYKFHDERTVTFYPNKTLYSHTDEFRIKFKTNKYGFNDFKFKEDTDILIIGDSFVQSIEVDRKKHFAEYIKQELKINVSKIGMSGYGNSHYFSNYLNFADLLNPKLVIIINFTNDLRNNFCDSNTQRCSTIKELCMINSKADLKKNIKFLEINDDNYEFNYTAKKNRNDIKIKILRNFIDKFQSYYSLRYIYTAYLKKKVIVKNEKLTKKIEETECQYASDNSFVRDYYNKINNLIYTKIVKIDKRNIIFVNIVSEDNNKDILFIKNSFEKNNFPHINFIHNDETKFKNDGHLNEFGHKQVASKIINFIKENYK